MITSVKDVQENPINDLLKEFIIQSCRRFFHSIKLLLPSFKEREVYWYGSKSKTAFAFKDFVLKCNEFGAKCLSTCINKPVSARTWISSSLDENDENKTLDYSGYEMTELGLCLCMVDLACFSEPPEIWLKRFLQPRPSKGRRERGYKKKINTILSHYKNMHEYYLKWENKNI